MGREPPIRGRMLSGTGFTPILTFPPQGGREGEGWVCTPILTFPLEGEGRGRDLFDAASGDTGSGVHYDGIGKHVVQTALIDSQTHH